MNWAIAICATLNVIVGFIAIAIKCTITVSWAIPITITKEIWVRVIGFNNTALDCQARKYD